MLVTIRDEECLFPYFQELCTYVLGVSGLAAEHEKIYLNVCPFVISFIILKNIRKRNMK